MNQKKQPKLSKKKIAYLSLVLCLAAIISLGSLAWFTDTDELENTLKFVTDFEMDLYEIDGDGNKVGEDAKYGDGITYQNITPGAVLTKKPIVVNKSSTEGQYIRMKVTVSNWAGWQKVGYTAVSDLKGIFDFDETNWTVDEGEETDGNVVFTAYLNTTLAAGTNTEDKPLFTKVTIPTGINNTDATSEDRLGGSFTVTVAADAIQASNLGEGVTTAADAFTR